MTLGHKVSTARAELTDCPESPPIVRAYPPALLVDSPSWHVGQPPTPPADTGPTAPRVWNSTTGRPASCPPSRRPRPWRHRQAQEHDRPGNKVDHVTPANDAPNRMICMHGLPYTYYLGRHSYSALGSGTAAQRPANPITICDGQACQPSERVDLVKP